MVERVDEAGAAPGVLVLRMLGPCALELDGRPLVIGGPKSQAVLLRLALADGHLVTADRLVADLWGDQAPASVVATLQGYISRLRSALGDPARLRREGPGYVLDLEEDQVDFRRFEALVDEAGSVADDPDQVVRRLDEALGLWRGSALVDVADTEWAGPSAVRLEERRLEAIEGRFDALLELGRHATAVPEIEQTVNDHPFRERFTAQLMTALYRCGRQADALRAYEKARRRLLDDAGLDPSPELVALESAILAHDAALQTPAPRERTSDARATGAGSGPATPASSPVATAVPPLPPAARRQAAQAFVGRADALEVIRRAWDEVVGGHRSLLLIEGEAGAGKSRLAARFAADVHAEGAIVLWGRSAEESILPYGPVVEALRTALLEAGPEVRERVIGSRPGLRSLRPFVIAAEGAEDPDVDGPVDGTGDRPGDGLGDGTDRYRLFEAVSELLHAESQVSPVLLVLDDLQWADAPTLRLLQHLLQHQRPGRVLLVATVRTVPVTDNQALEAFLWEARRDHQLSRIVLDGLSHDEVAELLRVSGSAEASSHRVEDVVLATRGNPFFVTALAEHSDGTSVPDSVRDVLGARMARLDADAVRLLSAAAVAGSAAPLDVLASASGLGGVAVLDALDEAIRAGLLAEEDAADTVVFRHALVQQVVSDRLSNLRRRGMHLAVAEAYAAAGGRSLDVAHHLVEAGSLVSPERTAIAAVAAGREALSMYAYEATVGWATKALTADGAEDPAVRCRALVLLSSAQRALGDREAARASASQATDAARSAQDPLLLASAAEAMMLARAGLGFDFGTADHELRALLAEALHGLTGDADGSPPELSTADPLKGGPSGLRWLPQDALGVAEANGQHALVATAHLAVRMSIWRVDTLEQRLEADRLGLAAAERSNQPPLLLNALLYLATDLTEAGQVAEASEQLERIREIADRIRQPAYDAFVDFFDAQQGLTRGEYERSAMLVDRALTVGGQSHGVNAELAWSGQVFIRSWDQGRLADMVGLLDAASAQATRATIFRVARSLSLVADGRGEEARATLADDIRSCWLDVNRDSVWLAIGGLFAEITRALDEPDCARIVVEHLRPYSGRIAVTGLGRASLGPVDRFIGVAASVAGDHEEAVASLRSAIDQARLGGAVAHEARAVHDLSVVLGGTRSPADAEEALRLQARAAELAGPIGLVLGPIAPADA